MSPPQFLCYEDCLRAESQGFEGAQEVMETPATHLAWAWAPGNFQFLGRWAWIPAVSSFGYLGVLHGGKHPSRAFQVLSRAQKSQFFFLASSGFYTSWTTNPPMPWESRLSEKSSKGNAVESTDRCALLFKKKTKQMEAGLLHPSRVLPSSLALAAPLVGWMHTPAAWPAARWALLRSA